MCVCVTVCACMHVFVRESVSEGVYVYNIRYVFACCMSVCVVQSFTVKYLKMSVCTCVCVCVCV